jgi:hypothetical protein
MRAIVRLKKAHEFAHSPLKEREMLGIWPEQSVFVINPGVNPTVLTECPFHGAKDQALKFPAFVNRFKKFRSKVISEGERHVFRWSVA